MKDARALFEQGKVIEANETLVTQELHDNQKELLEQKSELKGRIKGNQEKLKINADEYQIKAELRSLELGRKNRVEETIFYFEQSLLSYRTIDNAFQYAVFLYEHNLFEKAEEIFERILLDHKKELDAISIVHIKYFIAVAQSYLGKLNGSNNNYQDALEKIEGIIKGNSQHEDLSEMTRILNSQAILLMDMEDFDGAEQKFKKSLGILKDIAPSKTFETPLFIVKTYGNLGYLFQKKGNYEKSENWYNNAISLCSEIEKDDPKKCTWHKANIYQDLGMTQILLENFDKASISLHESIQNWKNMIVKNPEKYLDELTHTELYLVCCRLEQGQSQVESEFNMNKIIADFKAVIKRIPVMKTWASDAIRIVTKHGFEL